ncbi:hypothetical protein LCGC14_2880840, partial [marine sediment metagenome]
MARQRTLIEILDQQVDLGDQPADQILALRFTQIGGHRFLVAGQH